MQRATQGLLSVCLISTLAVGCEPEEPSISRAAFPVAMAEAVCGWVFSCCDSAERTTFTTDGQDLGACRTELTSQYNNQLQGVGDRNWDGVAAQGVVDDLESAAQECPRSFDPEQVLLQRNVVESTMGPGDMCATAWDCSTHFCKGSVCANPLPEGSPCSAEEPCANGLRCIAGNCKTLQVDGAACTTGAECYTGACVAGACQNVPTYTCDGK